jgi:hypothetical protein
MTLKEKDGITIPHSISASRRRGSPGVVGFHDAAMGSCQYIRIDPAARKCALIDVVLDFNPAPRPHPARTPPAPRPSPLTGRSNGFPGRA